MNPNIDTTDFTEKQQVIFLTTSVKSMTKILRKTVCINQDLEKENEELKKKIAYDKVHLDRLGKTCRELRKENRKLKRTSLKR